MKREQYYKNKRTGERTESHAVAMEWYRAKDEIEVWYWSEVCGEWLCGVEWVWQTPDPHPAAMIDFNNLK